MRFKVDELAKLLAEKGWSQTELSRRAGFENLKTVTDILSPRKKKKPDNVTINEAMKLAQALGVPISTFYETEAWKENFETVLAPPRERRRGVREGEPQWTMTSRNDVEKTKKIIGYTHSAKRCFAFSQAYFGHLLPNKAMFDWWEEAFCCLSLSNVSRDKLPEYKDRAREYYQHGMTLLSQADFRYQMITPLQLFRDAAAVNPDWVREFRRNLVKDGRIDLRIPTQGALNNAMEIIDRRTSLSKLYSVSTLDNDMVIVRMNREVYLHTVDTRAVLGIQKAVEEALKHVGSRSETMTLLDRIAQGKEVCG